MHSTGAIVFGLFAVLACVASKENTASMDFFTSLLLETDQLDSFHRELGLEDVSTPALCFDGSLGIRVNDSSLLSLEHLKYFSCATRSFLIHSYIKFSQVMNGTVFSLLSSEESVLLSLDFKKGNKCTVSFAHNGTPQSVEFTVDVTNPEKYYQIVVVFDGEVISLYVDCVHIGDRIVLLPDYCPTSSLQLTIAEHPFQGCIQQIGISFSDSALQDQCKGVLPVCDHSAAVLEAERQAAQAAEQLEKKSELVEQLQEELASLRKNQEVCDSVSTCFANGQQYNESEFYRVADSTHCSICVCLKGGKPSCTKVALSECQKDEGDSTTSTTGCNFDGVIIPDHQTIYLSSTSGQCSLIQCYATQILDRVYRFPMPVSNSGRKCSDQLQLKDCSKSANWTSDEKMLSECCGYCTACDLYSNCHEDAYCESPSLGQFTCQCKTGFYGDGKTCTDINECTNGYLSVEGHHCPTHAKCVNTAPGFYCECPKGYEFDEKKLACVDIDECKTENVCTGEHQVCNNTEGSYTCACEEHYTLSTITKTCQPVCDPPCQNGGTCTKPGVCSCNGLFDGPQCQNDIDECEKGVHGCHHHAHCINLTTGGHYCVCREGYHGNGKKCEEITSDTPDK